jgi:hypothetical protein
MYAIRCAQCRTAQTRKFVYSAEILRTSGAHAVDYRYQPGISGN